MMERSVRVPTVVATAVQLTILIIVSYCTVAAKVVVVAAGRRKLKLQCFILLWDLVSMLILCWCHFRRFSGIRLTNPALSQCFGDEK